MVNKISPEQQRIESKKIIKAVLDLDISNTMKSKVIDLMIWNFTGAYGKYKLEYISKSALENTSLKRIHEHVFRKKLMVLNILANPTNFSDILEEAVGCVVTEDDHRELNEIDRLYPDLDGWARYEKAKIEVLRLVDKKSDPD